MKPFAANVAVWKGFVPKTNSGWLIIDQGRVVIIDAKQRSLGEAKIADVRFNKTPLAMGAVTVHLGAQRFMVSQGGGAGVPDDWGGDVPDMSRHIGAAYDIEAALLEAGATPGGRTRAT